MAGRKDFSLKLAAVFPDTGRTPERESGGILRAVMHVLCSSNRPMGVDDVISRLLCQRSIRMNGSGLQKLFDDYPGLVDVSYTSGRITTYAVRLDIKLCTEMYNTKQHVCSKRQKCEDIHICKFFISGPEGCQKDHRCKFPHDLYTAHNFKIVKRLFLDDVRPADLYSRLREKFERKLDVCGFYDKEVTSCKDGDECQYLHFCRFKMDGNCKYDDGCNFNHDILGENCRAILDRVGIETNQPVDAILQIVRSHLNIVVAEKEHDQSACPDHGKTEICSYFIRGQCHSGKLCGKIHHTLPYMWQFNDVSSNTWTMFHPDEQVIIEQDYCKAAKSTTSLKNIERFISKRNKDRATSKLKFDDMNILDCQVRRLSTRGSVFTANNTPFKTCWIWYWKDDEDKWIPYSKQESRALQTSDKDSDDLEQLYQCYLSGEGETNVQFSTSIHHKYQLDFKEMKQTNQVHGKKRGVRRRPHRLVTTSDVDVYKKHWQLKMQRLKAMANQHMPLQKPAIKFPAVWSNCFSDLDASKEFCLVGIKKGTDEYDMISKELTAVVPSKNGLRVQRIHNFELWEDFYKKRSKMSAGIDGRNIKELVLWYGSKPDDVSTICQQNFDVSQNLPETPRVSFSTKSVKCMAHDPYSKSRLQLFRVRVLVNKVVEYSQFEPCTGSDWQSCSATCDSAANPSTYTVFSSDQLYPEYLITL